MSLEKKMDRIYTDKDDHHDDHDHDEDDDDDDVPLPGFRFHPTDEELVGFYLRRKVEKKPISFELIKSLDIYKHDPWDLPKATSTAGDKECYFFCKRGRKYKNSIRPNRVTGSGFWKATGIDKPIHNCQGHLCIGLKKTLVYYRGSAGKGTKTDWMMHEFRLPAIPTTTTTNHINNTKYRSYVKNNTTTDPQEAEIWTLCRIFKRNVSYRKYTPADWRDFSAATKRHPLDTTLGSKKCSEANHLQEPNINGSEAAYNIDFGASAISYEETKPHVVMNHNININASYSNNNQSISSMQLQATYPYMDSFTNFSYADENEFLNANWDELRSVVQFALDPTFQ